MVGACVKVPLGCITPLQVPSARVLALPVAVHVVALVDDQEIEVNWVTAMELAASVSVGAAGTTSSGVTVSATELDGEVPPVLLQASENVSVPTTVGVMVRLPLVACVPLQLPEAAQLAAFAEDQVSVAEPPTGTDVGVNVIVGAAGAVPEVTVRFAVLAADVPNASLQVSV